MTQTEFDHLNATLTQGCTSERQELIWLMTPRQRAEFAVALVFAHNDALQTATWRMLAVAMAQDAIRQLDQISEIERAYQCDLVGPSEISVSNSMTTDNLQGAH